MNKKENTDLATQTNEEEVVIYRTLKPGDATHFPQEGNTVRIQYEGFYDDGDTLFDSSIKRGQPFYFRLGKGQVIRGFDAAVAKMSLGQKMEIRLPPSYGYGAQGYDPIIPPNATLIYQIELLDFTDLV